MGVARPRLPLAKSRRDFGVDRDLLRSACVVPLIEISVGESKTLVLDAVKLLTRLIVGAIFIPASLFFWLPDSFFDTDNECLT